MAPQLRHLFPNKLDEQAQKLAAMLGVAVSHLPDLTPIAAQLRLLGRYHTERGVLPSHYPIVFSSFRSTLLALLGEAYTNDSDDAWRRTLEVLERMMTGQNT